MVSVMQYESLNDKQKQCIEMFRSWSEKLAENEVRKIKIPNAQSRGIFIDNYIIQYESFLYWTGWMNIGQMLVSVADYCKCSKQEFQDVFVLAKSKNFWLKFEPKLVNE